MNIENIVNDNKIDIKYTSIKTKLNNKTNFGTLCDYYGQYDEENNTRIGFGRTVIEGSSGHNSSLHEGQLKKGLKEGFGRWIFDDEYYIGNFGNN